ncbi:MAG: M23 family metallopeptidase, partial [Bacillales bacterium]
ISEFKDEMDKKYKLTVGSDLTHNPEQVGSEAKTNDREVIQKLDEQLAVEAEATAIVLDGKAAVYVLDKKTADKVIEALTHRFVSKEELEQLKKTKEALKEGKLPPLKENESRLLDVKLSKKVSYSSEVVPTNEVLDVDEAVEYLLKGTLEKKEYTVQKGDVLGTIASKHGMTVQQLLAVNPGLKEDSVLQIGQKVNVTAYAPLVEVITEKEVFKKETIPYKTQVTNDSSVFKGTTKVQRNGQEGLKEVTYKISLANGTQIKKEALEEKIIKEPVDKIVIKGTKVIPSRGTGSFIWPTYGGYISSYQGMRWGQFHKGIDIARPYNRTIKAADNGVVVFAGWDGGYGKKIIIDHRNGFRTVYA